MSLDEDIYVNLEEVQINDKQPHGREDTDSHAEGAEAVVDSETAHFKVATVCLAVLSFTLLITAVGVGVRYSTAYAQLMGRWLNSSLQTEVLQVHILNLTEERDQINTSYFSVMKELDEVKANTASCPDGWTRFGCRCYFLSQTSNTRDRSRRQCQNMAADLVVVKNQQEMTFLNKLGERFWIGLRRSHGESWRWTDGSSLIISYWQDNHPTPALHRDIYYTYNRDCAAFNRYSQLFFSTVKSWSSEFCNNYYQAVCEKEANLPSVI